MRTRPWDDREGRCLCGHGCAGRPSRMLHRTDNAAGWLVAAAASDATGRACKWFWGSSCSKVTWPRSLFASVDAAGATVDVHASSCAPLTQLSSDLNTPNHCDCEYVLNSSPVFGLPIEVTALCHSTLVFIFQEAISHGMLFEHAVHHRSFHLLALPK